MDSKNKIVTQLPLTNLWTDIDISAKREKYLTAVTVQETLKNYNVDFVIANVGEKLEWISYKKSFHFWKTELKPHLVDDINNINLERLPGQYAYVASEWSGDIESESYY